jgi:hypothetical protein
MKSNFIRDIRQLLIREIQAIHVYPPLNNLNPDVFQSSA